MFVEIKGLSKSFHTLAQETRAVGNVSFSIARGEFVSIVGPSGCGKSTILSIISGLLKATSGEVLINGESIEESEISIGYMLQKDHLFEWRSILSNVCLGLEVKGEKNEKTQAYAAQLLEKYGLGEFTKHLPSELSGGMRQRVALIRTLVLKPEILLLDEPFSALDYQTRLYVADEIGTIIRNEGKTAILVTHDISEAISLSDRVIVLTKRPSTVASIHDIKLSVEHKTALKAREAPEFRRYFNLIWKELDVHA